MAEPHALFDRTLLRRRKARAAAGLAGYDFLLRRAADDLAERLGAVNRRFSLALDLGAHGTAVSERLAATGKVDRVLRGSVSPALAGPADGNVYVGEEELLPFPEASLDLVVSCLALQLVNDLPGVLAQVRRALRPDGLLLAALLGGDTLVELRSALAEAESEVTGGISPRIAPFADTRDLGQLLQRTGFALPVADSDRVEVTYASALSLMRDLRGMGATNVLRERSRRPLRRRVLARTVELYADRFAVGGGRVRATFEIVTLTGWAPHASQQRPLPPGSAQARLADALRPRS